MSSNVNCVHGSWCIPFSQIHRDQSNCDFKQLFTLRMNSIAASEVYICACPTPAYGCVSMSFCIAGCSNQECAATSRNYDVRPSDASAHLDNIVRELRVELMELCDG